MKHNLFTWNDKVLEVYAGRHYCNYTDIVLKQDIGQFKVDTRFDEAYIDYSGDSDSDYFPVLSLINYAEGTHGQRRLLYMGKYQLSFKVLDVIDEPQ